MELLFPKNNETELCQEAMRLGHKEIILCYSLNNGRTSQKNLEIPQIPAILVNEKEKGMKISRAILVYERKDIGKMQKVAEMILGPATREFFEDKRVQGIVDVGLGVPKDHTHFRKSLTQVEAELAKKQEKYIFFTLSDLQKSKQPEVVLGRWLQDKETCKKAKCVLVSGASDTYGLRSRKDLENFWKLL